MSGKILTVAGALFIFSGLQLSADTLISQKDVRNLALIVAWADACRGHGDYFNDLENTLFNYSFFSDTDPRYDQITKDFEGGRNISESLSATIYETVDKMSSVDVPICDLQFSSIISSFELTQLFDKIGGLGTNEQQVANGTSSWIMVTSLIQPEYYSDPNAFPLKMTILEGAELDGSTKLYPTLNECEIDIQNIFANRQGYSLRRTVNGSALQAVRLQYLDVVQCVQIKA